MRKFSSICNDNYILNTGEQAAKRLDLLKKVYGMGSSNFLKKVGLRKGVNVVALVVWKYGLLNKLSLKEKLL